MLQRGERLAVIGPNGAGKSTFLKLLVGQLQPTAGFLKLGGNSIPSYYDQNLTGLDDHATVLREIHTFRRDLSEEQVRDHLGRFLFSGDDVEKEIRTLSGGERARVLLAKLVLKDHTFLILDEPTNHLDIKSREALEAALEGYDGALVVVSHDRAFLDNVCDRVLEIEDGQTRLYPGSYSEYAARKRRERDAAAREAREKEKEERERADRQKQRGARRGEGQGERQRKARRDQCQRYEEAAKRLQAPEARGADRGGRKRGEGGGRVDGRRGELPRSREDEGISRGVTRS